MIWRHGDVLIGSIEGLPAGTKAHEGTILVHGELTGHSHRIAEPSSAALFARGEDLYMQVVAPSTTIIHEEHAQITLPKGCYRIWQQREYTPGAIRRVVD